LTGVKSEGQSSILLFMAKLVSRNINLFQCLRPILNLVSQLAVVAHMLSLSLAHQLKVDAAVGRVGHWRMREIQGAVVGESGGD
jgi:hypothetical protein